MATGGVLGGHVSPRHPPPAGARGLAGLPLGADELRCSFLARCAFLTPTALSSGSSSPHPASASYGLSPAFLTFGS